MDNQHKSAYAVMPYYVEKGLTKREYFTAKAMQALISSEDNFSEEMITMNAKLAVKIADETLKLL